MSTSWQQDRANYVVQYSTNHGQAVGRGFAHPLGVDKFAYPLNDVFKLEIGHNGPNLRLVHPESNRSYIKNTTDALPVQSNLDSSNNRNDRTTNTISSPRITCSHQSRENRLRNHHYRQPTHPTEQSLKYEMLELGKINTSPWNYLPLSKFLFVPLVVLHGIEQDNVKPRLSTSLRLRELRRLSWALALCPKGSQLSPRSHEKDRNKRR